MLRLLILCFLFCFVSSNPESEAATKWLERHRDENYGWGLDTAKCITALQLADNSWVRRDRLDSLLTVKQLEVDMLLKFFNHREKVLSPGEVAWFVITLLSLCWNPRDFHGKDVVAVLQREEPRNKFELSLHTLAICLSDGHVKKRHARKVLEMTQSELAEQYLGSIDTFSLGLMSLQCLTRFHQHRPVSGYLNTQVKTLMREQEADGSFRRNVYSTALALQALSLYNESMGWDPTDALAWLRSQQQSDGSFLGYADATAVALPVLVGKGFRDLHEFKCNPDPESKGSGPFVGSALGGVSHSADTNRKITVSYTLWFDQEVSRAYTQNITVATNTSFYQVMLIAAEQDPTFEFSSSIWPNGHYIHTIGGYHERPTRAEGFHFWLLYKLDHKPDPKNKPPNSAILPVGVDDYFPEDGDFILFWFKQI